MNKIVSSKGVSISKLLKGTDAHGMLSTTAIQIAIFEVLKILGLTCLSKASHSNGEIADAFAKGNINLVQALHLAYKYDSLQKGTYGKISNGHHHTDIMVNDEENVVCLNASVKNVRDSADMHVNIPGVKRGTLAVSRE